MNETELINSIGAMSLEYTRSRFGDIKVIVDNPLVETWLIPAILFILICVGVWILSKSNLWKKR